MAALHPRLAGTPDKVGVTLRFRGVFERLANSRSLTLKDVQTPASLRGFHEDFILERRRYVSHERNCLHLGEQRGIAGVFKAHRKHSFRSVDGQRVQDVPAPVGGEVRFVALYDVLDPRISYEITQPDTVAVWLPRSFRPHVSQGRFGIARGPTGRVVSKPEVAHNSQCEPPEGKSARSTAIAT